MAMRSYLDDYLGQDEGQEIGRNIDAYMQHEESSTAKRQTFWDCLTILT